MKIIKKILFGLLLVILFCCVLMIIPRTWSALNPEKPPMGYHFVAPTYLAIAIGLESLINTAPEIPDDIEEIKNIEYKSINGKSLQLDIYKPKNVESNAPLLIFIHGGGWSKGERSDYLIYLVDFAKRGYITATVSYRLLKDSPYPGCVEDIRDAVNWFYENGENYGYDPKRIALIGGSAGAHLALMAAYEWEETKSDSAKIPGINYRIKAVVDIYGPVDLTTDYARNQSLVTSFIAHSYTDRPDLYKEASPMEYVDSNDPPTMILHGTSDDLVPVIQSDRLKAKLDSLGVPCVYHRLPLWPHTMDMAQRVNDYSQEKMNNFFEEYLK
jgi:acetyl esterase/lipase